MMISSLEGSFHWTFVIIFYYHLSFSFEKFVLKHPFWMFVFLKNRTILQGLFLSFSYRYKFISQFSDSNSWLVKHRLLLLLALHCYADNVKTFSAPFLGKYMTPGTEIFSIWSRVSSFFLARFRFAFFTKALTQYRSSSFYIFFTIGRNLAFNNTMALTLFHKLVAWLLLS